MVRWVNDLKPIMSVLTGLYLDGNSFIKRRCSGRIFGELKFLINKSYLFTFWQMAGHYKHKVTADNGRMLLSQQAHKIWYSRRLAPFQITSLSSRKNLLTGEIIGMRNALLQLWTRTITPNNLRYDHAASLSSVIYRSWLRYFPRHLCRNKISPMILLPRDAVLCGIVDLACCFSCRSMVTWENGIAQSFGLHWSLLLVPGRADLINLVVLLFWIIKLVSANVIYSSLATKRAVWDQRILNHS